MNKDRDQIILTIAKEHLFLETLETRNLDRLDFKEHSAEGIRRALVAAYEAGQKAAQ